MTCKNDWRRHNLELASEKGKRRMTTPTLWAVVRQAYGACGTA